ncbi:hypothetical protein H4R35_002607 [Dimargaris xerosporica]|nr:hypothetical protein H4R35_002607 [Dimargaris xerosporica]
MTTATTLSIDTMNRALTEALLNQSARIVCELGNGEIHETLLVDYYPIANDEYDIHVEDLATGNSYGITLANVVQLVLHDGQMMSRSDLG